MDKIQHFRQPIITASGIYIGFMLTFATQWVRDAFETNVLKDIIVFTSIAICIPLLIVVIYRMLTMRIPVDKEDNYYQRTLKLFVIAVTTPFLAIALLVVLKLIIGPAITYTLNYKVAP